MYQTTNHDDENMLEESRDEIISLSVGGTLFKTFKSTLTQSSNYFQALLEMDNEERMRVERDLDGNIFIDRDPTHFQKMFVFHDYNIVKYC